MVTQTAEPHASSTIINAIFSSPQDITLTEILTDANNGSQVIGKILAISTIPSETKSTMMEAVRRVLPTIKASNTPPYRLLLESVGLPVPPGAVRSSPMGGQPPPLRHNNHPNPQNPHWQPHTPPHQYGFYPYHQPMHTSPMPMNSMMGMNLSPLLMPQNMPLGQMRNNQHGGPGGGTTPNPNLTPKADQSPRTPVPHPRARLDMQHQMMSPASDPFNPVSAVSATTSHNLFGPRRLPNFCLRCVALSRANGLRSVRMLSRY